MWHIFLFPVSYRRFTLFGLNLSQNNMSTNSTNQDNQGNLSETTAEIEKVSNIMRNDTLEGLLNTSELTEWKWN